MLAGRNAGRSEANGVGYVREDQNLGTWGGVGGGGGGGRLEVPVAAVTHTPAFLSHFPSVLML